MNDLKKLAFEQLVLRIECERQVQSVPLHSSKEDQLKCLLKTIQFYVNHDPLNKIDLSSSNMNSKDILVHRLCTSKLIETCNQGLSLLSKK